MAWGRESGSGKNLEVPGWCGARCSKVQGRRFQDGLAQARCKVQGSGVPGCCGAFKEGSRFWEVPGGPVHSRRF